MHTMLFKENSILFIYQQIYHRQFLIWFSFSTDQHIYETSSSTQGNLIKLFYKTKVSTNCAYGDKCPHKEVIGCAKLRAHKSIKTTLGSPLTVFKKKSYF